jgi:hypothetical protein
LTEADLSIRIKQTLQQYGKSNSAAQDDEQRNAKFRRRNHKKIQTKKLDICENHLFILKKDERKM